MRINLRVQTKDACLLDALYDVSDAESFGHACADVWTRIQEQKITRTTSIGALYEALGESVLDELDGSTMTITRVR